MNEARFLFFVLLAELRNQQLCDRGVQSGLDNLQCSECSEGEE